MMESNLIQGDYLKSGFTTKLKLSSYELDMLRQLIRIQWLYRLQLIVPRKVHEFDKLGIEYYHRASHFIEHETAWPKTARVLPREAVALIRGMEFFKKLELHLGKFFLSDEEHLGWENIYWRIARPNNQDYGSLHADKWFWDVGGYGKVADFPHWRLKMWIAIYTVPGKNGFLLAEGSHLRSDWKWHSETKFGLNKPVLDEPRSNLNLTLLPLAPGDSVIFHDELIHGGSANEAETTRVSLEFTMLIPNKNSTRKSMNLKMERTD